MDENLLDKDIIMLLFKLIVYYGENENKIIKYLLDI